MSGRRRYRKRVTEQVVAVRLALDTAGFLYRKWGSEQYCKPGDYIVDNGTEVYTVDAGSFLNTYRLKSPGVYVKCAPVWAEMAARAGTICTKEGISHYKAGDYLVCNDDIGADAYCVARSTFEATYQLDD